MAPSAVAEMSSFPDAIHAARCAQRSLAWARAEECSTISAVMILRRHICAFLTTFSYR